MSCIRFLEEYLHAHKHIRMSQCVSSGKDFSRYLGGGRCAIVDLTKPLLVKERCSGLELLDPQVGPFFKALILFVKLVSGRLYLSLQWHTGTPFPFYLS